MMSISEAMERLANVGLVVRYNQDQNRMSGGYELENSTLKLGGLVNTFSIQFDGEWFVRMKLGQLLINISKSTLSEAVEVVCRLYESPSQFSDFSITVEAAIERLKPIGLPVSFNNKKLERIILCAENPSGDDCIKGISILRQGSYFIVVKFGGGPSSILYYGETLIDAVEYLLAL